MNSIFAFLCDVSIILAFLISPLVLQTTDTDMDQSSDNGLQKSVLVNGRFQNPWPTWTKPSYTDALRIFMFGRDHSNVPRTAELDRTLPIVKPNFEALDDKLSLTWIGHSTVLFRIDGLNVLADPIFSGRASMTQFLGPHRYRRAACRVSDLPAIDAVIISHNHYDHLDVGSVRDLNERFSNRIYWFVPLRMARWMRDNGCENVIELDWWQEATIPDRKDITFALTPAQHWSKRTITDDNRALWGSWAVMSPTQRFFFAGDTGYCSVFKEIGDKYGPFDLSAIPIGAYEPEWFMKPQHVKPEDSVRIHMDVKSKQSVGIHWGTFPLTYEHYLEPPEKLKAALQANNLDENSFIAIKHGETKSV